MRSLAAWLGFLGSRLRAVVSDRPPARRCSQNWPFSRNRMHDQLRQPGQLGLRQLGARVPLPGGAATRLPPGSTPRVISVGEQGHRDASALLCHGGPAVFEILFELTAPSDGTLVVHPSSGVWTLYSRTSIGRRCGGTPGVLSTVATLQVTAGQTYRLSVYRPRPGTWATDRCRSS